MIAIKRAVFCVSCSSWRRSFTDCRRHRRSVRRSCALRMPSRPPGWRCMNILSKSWTRSPSRLQRVRTQSISHITVQAEEPQKTSESEHVCDWTSCRWRISNTQCFPVAAQTLLICCSWGWTRGRESSVLLRLRCQCPHYCQAAT